MVNTIINHPCKGNFTIIPNDLLQNGDLSFYARGVLTYILSLPSNWEINVQQITSKFDESERKILAALRELISLGYCKRVPLHKDGKLRGQRYMITDIPYCFTEPAKNGDTESAAEPAKEQRTENSAPLENGGSIKEYNLFEKETIDEIEKDREHTRFTSENRDILFVKSRYFDFEKFAAEFTAPEYANVDLAYYYNRIKNWSASGGKKKKDWIATARSWMQTDSNQGRLKQAGSGLTPDAIKYLQDMAPSDFELGIRR